MKKILLILLGLVMLVSGLGGCSGRERPSPDAPVTLTMWHVYGSQTESPLNNLIDEFNRTVGRENGVTIHVVSVTSSSAIDKALKASADGEPGAEKLPDLFTAYPRVAEIVGHENLLAWDEYFTETELDAFEDSFLGEGYFDGRILMLPIAKSTEAFYINKTIFDRFSRDTGITTDLLTSFDGIFSAANAYYDWSDGQNFLQINDYYHYAFVGTKTLGSEFIVNGRLMTDAPAFEAVWNPLAEAAIYGGICLDDGYAASRWKTVEIIANTGSTADILYQPDFMVNADNSTEEITAITLPFPVFDADNPIAVHRGGGLFALRNEDERKNYAAYIFAEWLTESENNLAFASQAGYLPVTTEGFELLFDKIDTMGESSRSLYQAVDTMMSDYTLYALPLYAGASEKQLAFEKNVKTVLKSAHNHFLKRVSAGEDADAVLRELTAQSLDEIRRLSAERGE
ncbi:MAG: extracellular solute-binding protein [Clostridia bacterium]|nr:extracellular solute-binding protein [Clostridia bacterium]